MRRVAALSGLALLGSAGPLHAGAIAVLAKNEIVVVGPQVSGAIPDDPARASFLEAFRADVRDAAPFPVTLPLGNPPEWGKTISAETSGQVSHRAAFPQGFIGHLRLEHLEPHHRYILTLNGRPDLPGNDVLPTPVPGLEAERYYDFLFIETDADGSYEATLGVLLPPALYQVRLYVKDAVDFKIVLYHDYFPFTVTPGAAPAPVATTPSDNLQRVRAYWDQVWSRGELEAVADFYAPDCKHGTAFTIEGFQKNVSRFRTAFPDLQVDIDTIFAADDRVITQVTYRGTHSGAAFLGQAPLNRPIEVPGLDVFVMRDGQCVEHLHVADHLELVLQMGLTLQPTAASAQSAPAVNQPK